MSRTGVGRTKGSAEATKFGGGPLLRTKHIDTLEVLEEYSKDIDRLQKENKALQQQLTKMNGLSGDPHARIQQLETILNVERDSNTEMSQRIRMLQGEEERYKTDLSNREIAHRSAIQELQSQYRTLHDTHAACSSSHSALQEQREEFSTAARRKAEEMESECARMRELMEAQNVRLKSLETTAAASIQSAPSTATDEALRLTKVKLTKTKERLAERETAVAKLLDDVQRSNKEKEQIREECHKAEKASAAATQQLEQLHLQLQQTARKTDREEKYKRDREDWVRKEKGWSKERESLIAELESIRRTAHQQSSASSTGSRKEDLELIQRLHARIAELEREVSHLREEYQHLQDSYVHVKNEHAKVASALNRSLNSGAAQTITIASKRGMFPEMMQVKREKEALEKQVHELQQTIHTLNTRIAQTQVGLHSALASATNVGPSNIQQLQRVNTRPPPIPAISSSKSLSLIAAHENSLPPTTSSSTTNLSSSSVASLNSSPSGSPKSGFSAATAAQRAERASGIGVGVGRRSSGGWSTAATTSTGQQRR